VRGLGSMLDVLGLILSSTVNKKIKSDHNIRNPYPSKDFIPHA
jgi:hypothetical protein